MLDLSYNKEINDKSCRALRSIFSSKSPIKYLNLDGTSITQKGFAVIMQGTTDNLKVREISLQNTRIKIREQDRSRQKVVEALKQNVSLTDLHLDSYRDDEFFEILQTELEKNRQIVNIIFPKLLEQEEKAI